MNRILAATVMGLMLTATSVSAADDDRVTSLAPGIAAAVKSAADRPEAAAGISVVPHYVAPRRPMLLPSLYVGSAILQGYDAYTTLNGLKAGAVEANPMMKTVTKSPVAFVTMKAGVTAASILAAERLWKDDHRVGAVLMMVVSNGVMGVVAAHNASTLRRLQ